MDTNAVVMKQKFQFEKFSLEKGYQDYGIFPNHVLKNLGKDMDDIQEKMKTGEMTRKQVLL